MDATERKQCWNIMKVSWENCRIAQCKAPKGTDKRKEIKGAQCRLERIGKVPKTGEVSEVELTEAEVGGFQVLPLTRALKTMVSNSSGPSSVE